MLSIGINLVSQALIARHLSQADFGAFALAFSIASVGQVFITLGLHRGATQFFARYEEAGDHRRLVGTILFNIAVIVGLGAVLVIGVAFAQGALTSERAPGSDGDRDPADPRGPCPDRRARRHVDRAVRGARQPAGDLPAALSDRPVAAPDRGRDVGPRGRGRDAAGDRLPARDAPGPGRRTARSSCGSSPGAGCSARCGRHHPTVPIREVLAFSVPLLSNDGVWLLVNTLPLIVLTAFRAAWRRSPHSRSFDRRPRST